MLAAAPSGSETLPIALALAAALCIGLGMALEHRGAARARHRSSVHPGLVLDLVRSSPAWRAGLLLTVAGYGLQAAAFGTGRLVVVEPLLILALVVSLAASGLLARRPLTRAQWLAALATAGAVVLFTAVATPNAGRASAPIGSWAPWLGGVGGALGVVALVSPRWSPRWRAGALAACAGCAFGISDALTKSVADAVGSGGAAVLATWFPYALGAVGVAAFLTQQSAYHAGRLADAQPALSVSEPLVGSIIGVSVLREHVHGTTPETVAAALAVAVMTAGIVVLGRLADRPLPVPGMPLAGGPVRDSTPEPRPVPAPAPPQRTEQAHHPAPAPGPARADHQAPANHPGEPIGPAPADHPTPVRPDMAPAARSKLAMFTFRTRRRRVPFTPGP